MVLNIETEKDISDFCKWLIPKMQEYFVKSINDKKLEKYTMYLNGNKVLLFNYNEKRIISAKNILIGGIYNLRTKRSTGKFTIEINPNIPIPNTSAKFIDIVKLINYGNLSLQGYPIVDKTMNYFADNINIYYTKFLKESK